jgi:cytidyltransferase-like protein
MILILGAFDGFHLGHRRLLETAASMASDRSPAKVLAGISRPQVFINRSRLEF